MAYGAEVAGLTDAVEKQLVRWELRMLGFIPQGARASLALGLLPKVLPTATANAAVSPLVRRAEEWWLATGARSHRLEALEPPTLVRAFAGVVREAKGKTKWRRRRRNPVAAALHLAQRIG